MTFGVLVCFVAGRPRRAESALLPDVARLRDVYHPAACLYDAVADRDWRTEGAAAGGVHIGFFASTVLAEFAVPRAVVRGDV